MGRDLSTQKDKEAAKRAVDRLNRMLQADPEAITKLVEHRVSCTSGLAQDPSCQVAVDSVGMLGVINGLFGTDQDSFGLIAAVFNGDKVVRFVLYDRLRGTAVE